MSEASLWESLRPHLAVMGLDPHRVENGVGVGTPDVNYTRGWIELKDSPAWPVRADTLVRLPKLEERPGQVVWLKRRWRAGGLCWLLIRIGVEKLLIDGWNSDQVRDGLVAADLRRLAVWRSTTVGLRPDDRLRLVRWLNGDVENLRPHERAKSHRLRAMMRPAEVAEQGGFKVSAVYEGEADDGTAADDLLSFWEA